MRKLPLIIALFGSSLAYAEERVTIITIGGMAGGVADPQEPTGMFGPRVSLGWETAPLELPAKPGYVFDVALVPELIGGALVVPERTLAFIGAGLRGELKLAQREQGLLKVSARGSVYLAVRGMVIGEDRTPLGEIAFGQYFVVGRNRTRIGYELDVLMSREQTDSYDYYDRMDSGRELTAIGGLFQLYIGWAP